MLPDTQTSSPGRAPARRSIPPRRTLPSAVIATVKGPGVLRRHVELGTVGGQATREGVEPSVQAFGRAIDRK